MQIGQVGFSSVSCLGFRFLMSKRSLFLKATALIGGRLVRAVNSPSGNIVAIICRRLVGELIGVLIGVLIKLEVIFIWELITRNMNKKPSIYILVVGLGG